MKNLIYLTQSDEYSFSKPSLRYWLTKNLITFLTIILILLPQQSCNTTEPPGNQTLKLELEDVSCTEAWLHLTTTNLQLPTTVNVLKNNSVAQTFSLSTADTLLYIDSLLPNKNYSFQVSSIQSATGGPVSPEGTSSNELTVTTMDTTSHEFIWQSWEFGTTGSSVLYDVAIIDENDIWAVGEINIADTSINGYTTYNAVHWDGTKWELKKIYFPTVCGNTSVTTYPAKAIFTFDDGQIWISSSGDKIARLKNGVQIDKFCLPSNVSMSINKLWGSSSNDLYAVGNNGNIAHWDGRRWTKIESGTTLNINDVWSFKDYNGNNFVLCPAYNFATGGEKKLIKIENNKVSEVSWNQSRELYTCWFNTPNKIYAGGEGLFYKIYEKWKEEVISHYFVFRVRGNNLNDIWAAGGFGFVAHYNGKSWKIFDQISLRDGNYIGLTVRGNIVTIVGQGTRKAVITIGK